MFEVVFIDQTVKLGIRHDNAEKMWNEIASKYRETKRHYHTLQHLEHMFLNILEVKNEINDWQSVIFSIAFLFIEYLKVEEFKETNKTLSGSYQIGALLPIIMIIFFILAARGIYKDEKLVKSLDRLR